MINEGVPRIVDSSVGVHISYRVYGHGEPMVVLIHGWACDSNYWAAQIADLAARYTVVTLDLAGHGASNANRDDWSMNAFARDVAAVVEALPTPRRVVLVGHSMGAPVAVEAAALLADRTIGVIAVDSLKRVGGPRPSEAEIAARHAALEKDFIGGTRALVAKAFFRPDADPAFVRRVADDMAQEPPEVALPAMDALARWDAVPALQRLTVPIVAINSDLNSVTDDKGIQAVVPRFRSTTLPGTGHFLMMQEPKRFNPVLIAEIDRLGAVGAQKP
jgi:pimeloyl-ACP methyl ester carboxylesterase